MPARPTRRAVLAVAAALIAATLAPAGAADDPIAFAKSLYALQSLWSDVLAEPAKYLTEDFAKVVADNDKYNDDLDYAVDYDPLAQAQDWDQLENQIFVLETSGTDTATVKVDFTNFDATTTVHLDLHHTDKGWRLADLHNADGGSLLKEYAGLNAAGKAATNK